MASHERFFPGPYSTRPASAPVWRSFSTVTAPFTITYRMPAGYW